MTKPQLPLLAPLPDLLRSALGMISSRIAEDSRRNANEAFTALLNRRDDSEPSQQLMATLRPSPTAYRELA